jgi:erythromycin esterase
MRQRTVLLACLAIAAVVTSSAAQDGIKAEFLKAQAVPVRSIEPADEDFEDLMPLVALLADVRVIGLGEQTHGDGAAFHAKTRLIRFLHQVMGYDVLVWESGMYSCHLIEQALRRGEPLQQAWRKGIFGVWCASEQVQPLLDYVHSTRATERPIEIAGADSQMTGPETAVKLQAHLADVVQRANTEDLTDAAAELAAVFAQVGAPGAVDPALVDLAHEVGELLIEELEDDGGGFAEVAARRERQLLGRALRNLLAQVIMRSSGEDMAAYSEAREPAFGATLQWLAEECYPDRRLIFWAASTHLNFNPAPLRRRNPDGSISEPMPLVVPMGRPIHEALGKEYYALDFIAYEGQIGSVAGWSRPLEAARPDTLDGLCAATGHENLFVDLRTLSRKQGGEWLGETFVARPRGYIEVFARWQEVCDGFFFTHTMYPSTRVKTLTE